VRDSAERLAEQQRLGGFDGGQEHRNLDGQQKNRKQHLARADVSGHRREERPHGAEADRAERDDQGETGKGAAQVDVEEDHEQGQHERLDDRHEGQVRPELPEVDGRLVARREEQSLPAVVLTLDHERAPQCQQRAQDEAQPQDAGQHAGQALAVRPQRELEDEQQQQREEQQRVERLLRAPLDQQVLPCDHQRPARERHAASSLWAA